MTRILVTGGGGFLGGWISKLLIEGGHEVRIFDRGSERRVVREVVGGAADDLDWVEGDVMDGAAVTHAAEGCAAIVHLAALLTPACAADPVRGAEVNLIGTLNVFEAAKARGIRRIAYASSAAVFGPDDGEHPRPVTMYGAFKLAGEGCARAYWHDAGIASVGLRPTVVYGPGREIGLTAGPTLACREAVAGRPYVIGYTGRQDLVFAGDVAAAFAAAATRNLEGAHAVSLGGSVVDVPDIVAAIEAEVPGAVIGFEGPAVPMASNIAGAGDATILGLAPRTTLRDGIARTVAHYRRVAGEA
ncbi:NAD-dependent epimerase/dehydratase family protein [Aureimonas pseudogalii]|uniref:Nucleoside-diphosphate-sugar epimerase n=1 Tax=Aureimonas pseudogalii TaxID=1744844 RepID=A0A7W6MLV3_9HYPH|nr:NAD(P)-dependent oxidoreductase [Aureimonas pseudogalii]MBB4000183.1 nucleoside-diphosphate-sugar epimerase [Aureimonas pseudogalii]